MAAAAILKNLKIVIFPPHFDRFRPSLSQRRISTNFGMATHFDALELSDH